MDYYASRGCLVPIRASGTPEEILKRSLGLLNKRCAESGVKEERHGFDRSGEAAEFGDFQELS
jgi:hypothetical protein